MAAANQRARDAAGMNEVVTAESLARDYAYLVNSDLDRGPRSSSSATASIVGYGRVEWRDLENGSRTFAAIALLDPDAIDAGHLSRDARLGRGAPRRQGPGDPGERAPARRRCGPTRSAPRRRSWRVLESTGWDAHRPRLRDGPADPRRHPGRPDAGRAGRAADRPR